MFNPFDKIERPANYLADIQVERKPKYKGASEKSGIPIVFGVAVDSMGRKIDPDFICSVSIAKKEVKDRGFWKFWAVYEDLKGNQERAKP